MGETSTQESKVRISPDGMKAYLLVRPKESGEPYSKTQIMDLIREGKVVHGIDETAVDAIVRGECYNQEVCIARGEAPVDGKDGFFQYNFNTNPDASKPEVREDGSVDYWSVHAIEIVEEGQTIVVYHEPIEGRDGVSVLGKPILAKRGRPQQPLSGKGFSRAADGLSYTADITGKIEMVNNRIQVRAVHEVGGDVDIQTGNIDFRGDVIVHGNVCAGAVIKATGTVTVDGLCEACTIEADKDIVLRGGVLGAYKAVIKSKGDIHAKFFEYATIEAEGMIDINSALSCNITSYDRVVLSGKQASIVGGDTYGAVGVEADTLGSPSEVKTIVRVGATTEMVHSVVSLQNQLNDKQNLLKRIVDGLTQFEQMAKQQKIDVSMDERRLALLRTKMTMQAEVASMQKALDRLNGIMLRSKGAAVRVIHNVYPGTSVTIDQAVNHVKDQQKTLEFVRKEDKVIMKALDEC